jgi:AcrR family transcriptional regulator
VSRPRSLDDVLSASLGATAELARSGGAASVAELAAAAGISPRTFYRYFPRKEDCIRPALRDARGILMTAFRERPAEEPLATAFLNAFTVAAGGAFAQRTAALIPTVAADSALTAVWDHEIQEGNSSLTVGIAQRLGLAADDLLASSTAAVLLAMARLAFQQLAEQGGDVVEHLDRRLESLRAIPIFSPNPENTATAQ